MFTGELAKPGSLCIGAFGDDGELVGFLVVSRYVDAWHVMNLAVAPASRGAGLGAALMERLFELTAEDGNRGYTLEVRVSNAAAIRLYERLGFSAKGMRRRGGNCCAVSRRWRLAGCSPHAKWCRRPMAR